MADNTESSFGNFSIENTIEMGMGDTQLIDNFLGSESSSADPDSLTKIAKEVEDTPPADKPGKVKEVKDPEEKPLPTGQDLIAGFLGGSEDDDDEGEKNNPPIKKEEKPADDTIEENTSDSQFSLLANDLKKLGVFTSEEGEDDAPITTPEEFLERFKAEKQKGANEMLSNFLGQFGEDYKHAFQAIFVNGADPKEYFGTYNNIVSFAELDLTQEENQIAVIKQALLDQGWEPEDITTEIDRLKNYGDLESVSAKNHKVLVKKEALKLQQIEQKAEHELKQRTALKNQYVQNVQTILQEKLKTKEFDGIPLNPKLATELHDFLLVDKYKTANGELLTDFDKTILELKKPENHAMKVKVALLLKTLEKDPTLTTIQRTGVTKKSDELFSSLARQTTKAKPVDTGKPDKWFL